MYVRTTDGFGEVRRVMVSGRPAIYSYSVLEKMIKGRDSTKQILAYIKALKAEDQVRALQHLENYQFFLLESTFLLRAMSPEEQSRIFGKMERVLAVLYRDIAMSRGRGTGIRRLGRAEKARIADVLKPKKYPTLLQPKDFKSTLLSGRYEDKIRKRLTEMIISYHQYAVKIAAERRAGAAKLTPMAHFEQIGNAATTEVHKVFARYAKCLPSEKNQFFKVGKNLFDLFETFRAKISKMSRSEKLWWAEFKLTYFLQVDPDIRGINNEHNAVVGRMAKSPGEPESEFAILKRVRRELAAVHTNKLLGISQALSNWFWKKQVWVQRKATATETERRKQFWVVFQTMIHEYLHSLMHRKYNDYAERFRGGAASHEYHTLVEGMASLLTEIVWSNVHPKCPKLRAQVEGPLAKLPFDAAFIPPIGELRYRAYCEAVKLVAIVGIENLYGAYFCGRISLIAAKGVSA